MFQPWGCIIFNSVSGWQSGEADERQRLSHYAAHPADVREVVCMRTTKEQECGIASVAMHALCYEMLVKPAGDRLAMGRHSSVADVAEMCAEAHGANGTGGKLEWWIRMQQPSTANHATLMITAGLGAADPSKMTSSPSHQATATRLCHFQYSPAWSVCCC